MCVTGQKMWKDANQEPKRNRNCLTLKIIKFKKQTKRKIQKKKKQTTKYL